MQVIREAHEAASWSAKARLQGRSIGFVPTMGALHEGHLALIAEALRSCSAVVASVFVNPLQFNNKEDLRNYPRQEEQDLDMLKSAGCQMVFLPTAAGIYADHAKRVFELGGLDMVLEGASRPGHFQGVVSVVERLFHYVRPDLAFFGEKDRQQLAIVQYVARTLRWPEKIVPVPTVRAADGLALSSRNQRLNDAERATAPVLYRALEIIRHKAFRVPMNEALAQSRALLASEPAIRSDYLEIADPSDLRPLEDWSGREEAVALIAAWLGPVRLIDNITLRREAASEKGWSG